MYTLAFQKKILSWLDGKQQTIPGKSCFIILRMYGPLEPWINKTWSPDEIGVVK